MRFGKDLRLCDATKTGIIESGFEFVPNGYHPFSYYVLGGIDISGEATALNGNAESDDAGDLTTAVNAGYGYDPRLSGFDIAEAAGADAYEQVREMAKTAAKNGESSEESSEVKESTK